MSDAEKAKLTQGDFSRLIKMSHAASKSQEQKSPAKEQTKNKARSRQEGMSR